jgi:CheY-like chemotaxis protein
MGAQPAQAASAEEALVHVADSDPPDAVVADYRLGDSLGTEVVEAIRRRAARRVPAIVVTGSSSEDLLRMRNAKTGDEERQFRNKQPILGRKRTA